MTKRKKHTATAAAPTLIGEMVARLLDIDRQLCGGKLSPAREQVLVAEETFVVGQIVAATPASLADCVPMLMIAADKATTLQAMAQDARERSPEMSDRDSQHAAELSAVVASVLRYVAAKANVDLDAIGDRKSVV